jgi:hypothetical protein
MEIDEFVPRREIEDEKGASQADCQEQVSRIELAKARPPAKDINLNKALRGRRQEEAAGAKSKQRAWKLTAGPREGNPQGPD